MKLSEVNEWLGLIANVGVLAGIIFLGLEIQQNSEILRNQNEQTRTDSLVSSLEWSFNSEFIVPILNKVGSETPLDSIERNRYVMWFIASNRVQDFNYYQVSTGVIGESNAQSIRFFVESIIAPWEYSRGIWNFTKPNYSDEYITFVENVLEEI